jgi:hypothetical protein
MPISAARSVPSLQSIRLQVASCLCRMGVMGDASNANDGKADDSFAGWWLGGFGCAGAIVAGVLGAVFADLGFVESALNRCPRRGPGGGYRVSCGGGISADSRRPPRLGRAAPRLEYRPTVSTPRSADRPSRSMKVACGSIGSSPPNIALHNIPISTARSVRSSSRSIRGSAKVQLCGSPSRSRLRRPLEWCVRPIDRAMAQDHPHIMSDRSAAWWVRAAASSAAICALALGV